MNILKKNLHYGFTLAEILIVIGILGVVAGLSIPSVLANIKHQELKSRFQKSYSIISQAVIQTKLELGTTTLYKDYTYYDGTTYPYAKDFKDAFYKQLRITGTQKYPKPPVNFNNTANLDFYSQGSATPPYILPDGSSIFVNVCGYRINFSFDTNGPLKKPNRAGYDIFLLVINSSKDALDQERPSSSITQEQIDADTLPAILGTPCNNTTTQAGNGMGCSYYALRDQSPDDPTKGYWDSLK